ncbi:MAG: membrane protein insertase YidC [Thermodesulfobacteriota bacterium]|nr:membrane protein insertase YidC [Thermodesulfobacteriota bacterium]
MDKRTLLALGLSFLVFLAWSLLFGPEPKNTQEDKKLANETEEAQPKPKEKSIPSVTRPAIIVENEKNFKDITVETNLYTAVFSGASPLIKSFKLKNYLCSLEKDSPLKELINTKNKDGSGFSVGFSGQNVPLLNTYQYSFSGQNINIREGGRPEEIIYRWLSPEGLEIQIKFIFYDDNYKIDVSAVINNNSNYVVNNNLSLNLSHFPAGKSKRYGVFEGMGIFLNKKLKQVNVKKIKDSQFSEKISWVSYEEPYFIKAIMNEKAEKASVKGITLPDGEINISYMPLLTVEPGEKKTSGFILYFGPKDISILKSLHNHLEKSIHFGWFDIIAKPILYTLRFFNKYVSNYGVSIILITIIIKILFWPLTHKSYQSMKEMRKLQPMMAKIREKYKNNKQEMQKQLMNLYKIYKINPMGGCLPMIVQIPVFFALYRVLPGSIELRHAPFMLWIKDLSAPDRLFSFPFEIPFMSPPYGVPVLTLIMGASMFLQQKMTPVAGDPAQAKMMMFLPIIFTFMFINFPSGLVLYWLVNNLLSIAQQYKINKQVS